MNKKSDKKRPGFYEHIQAFYKGRKPPQVILDLGCGVNVAYESIFKNAVYIGVDRKLKLLEHRRKLSSNPIICQDFYKRMPIEKNSVDLIILHGSYNTRRRGFFKQAHRMLKKNGIVVIWPYEEERYGKYGFHKIVKPPNDKFKIVQRFVSEIMVDGKEMHDREKYIRWKYVTVFLRKKG